MIIGSKIEKHAILSSTNSHSTELLKRQKPAEGTVIQAGFQSGGRGQGSNHWESEADKNLLFSVILYPDMVPAQDQFLLSVFFSLGIADFTAKETDNTCIKWPNDIYVNDDKIAGILIENAISGSNTDHTIAGAGININQKVFSEEIPNPTSLTLLTGKYYDTDKCLGDLLGYLDRRYKQLIKGETDLLRSDYLERLYKRGQKQKFKDNEGIFTGTIEGVNGTGQLKIKADDGSNRVYSFREVEFIKQPLPSR